MTEQALSITDSSTPFDLLLDPLSPEWQKTDEMGIELSPAPLDRQPSAYIQKSWSERRFGLVNQIFVRAIHNRNNLAVHLRWRCDHASRRISDINVYADACAIMFPLDSVLTDMIQPQTMGSPEFPVGLWYWRAGVDQTYSARAMGIGTVERDHENLKARGICADDHWQVVISGDIQGLGRVKSLPVAFAVWAGANAERGGIKSHSPEFCNLRLPGSVSDQVRER